DRALAVEREPVEVVRQREPRVAQEVIDPVVVVAEADECRRPGRPAPRAGGGLALSLAPVGRAADAALQPGKFAALAVAGGVQQRCPPAARRTPERQRADQQLPPLEAG